MTVRVSKQPIDLRSKLSELERPIGVKGNELMRAETAQEARDLVSAGRRNLIINGNYDFWQRSTSTTGALSNAYGSADRWIFNTRSCSTRNISRQSFTTGQSDVPGNPVYYLRGEFSNNSGSIGVYIMQRIEDARVGAGQFVTASFYAKVNSGGGNVDVALSQQFGSGGSSATDNVMGTFTPDSTWKKYSFTIVLSSLSGKTVGTDSYLRLDFRMPSNTAITFDVARVQLEVGKNATDFEHRSYGEELALCERYFQKYSKGSLMWASPRSPQNVYTDFTYGVFKYRAPMRAAPTVGVIGSNFSGVRYNGSGYSTSNIALSANTGTGYTTLENTGADSTTIRIDWGFNWTINDLVNVVCNNTDSALTFSAEL